MITCDKGHVELNGAADDVCLEFIKIGVCLKAALTKKYGKNMANVLIEEAIEVINVCFDDEEATC